MSERITLLVGRLFTLRIEDLRDERAQGAVEYALAVLAVAAVIALAMAGFTNEITSFMAKAGSKLKTYVP